MTTIHFASEKLDAACIDLGIRFLVAFGSRMSNSPPPAPDSDLDIAFTLGRNAAPYYFWNMHERLADVFPDYSVDVVFLSDADPLLRWEIIRAGMLLWGDPDDFAELKAFAYRDFVDSADLRALERRLFDKKIHYIGTLLHASS